MDSNGIRKRKDIKSGQPDLPRRNNNFIDEFEESHAISNVSIGGGNPLMKVQSDQNIKNRNYGISRNDDRMENFSSSFSFSNKSGEARGGRYEEKKEYKKGGVALFKSSNISVLSNSCKKSFNNMINNINSNMKNLSDVKVSNHLHFNYSNNSSSIFPKSPLESLRSQQSNQNNLNKSTSLDRANYFNKTNSTKESWNLPSNVQKTEMTRNGGFTSSHSKEDTTVHTTRVLESYGNQVIPPNNHNSSYHTNKDYRRNMQDQNKWKEEEFTTSTNHGNTSYISSRNLDNVVNNKEVLNKNYRITGFGNSAMIGGQNMKMITNDDTYFSCLDNLLRNHGNIDSSEMLKYNDRSINCLNDIIFLDVFRAYNVLTYMQNKINLIIMTIKFIGKKLKRKHVPEEVVISLEFLSFCVKNLGLFFIKYLDESFMKKLSKLLRTTTLKNSLTKNVKSKLSKFLIVPNMHPGVATDPRLHFIKRKILFLLQLWHDSFILQQNLLPAVFLEYKSLKEKGITFPIIDKTEKFLVKDSEMGLGEEGMILQELSLKPNQISNIISSLKEIENMSWGEERTKCIFIISKYKNQVIECINKLSEYKGNVNVSTTLNSLLYINDQLSILNKQEEERNRKQTVEEKEENAISLGKEETEKEKRKNKKKKKKEIDNLKEIIFNNYDPWNNENTNTEKKEVVDSFNNQDTFFFDDTTTADVNKTMFVSHSNNSFFKNQDMLDFFVKDEQNSYEPTFVNPNEKEAEDETNHIDKYSVFNELTFEQSAIQNVENSNTCEHAKMESINYESFKEKEDVDSTFQTEINIIPNTNFNEINYISEKKEANEDPFELEKIPVMESMEYKENKLDLLNEIYDSKKEPEQIYVHEQIMLNNTNQGNDILLNVGTLQNKNIEYIENTRNNDSINFEYSTKEWTSKNLVEPCGSMLKEELSNFEITQESIKDVCIDDSYGEQKENHKREHITVIYNENENENEKSDNELFDSFDFHTNDIPVDFENNENEKDNNAALSTCEMELTDKDINEEKVDPKSSNESIIEDINNVVMDLEGSFVYKNMESLEIKEVKEEIKEEEEEVKEEANEIKIQVKEEEEAEKEKILDSQNLTNHFKNEEITMSSDWKNEQNVMEESVKEPNKNEPIKKVEQNESDTSDDLTDLNIDEFDEINKAIDDINSNFENMNIYKF